MKRLKTLLKRKYKYLGKGIIAYRTDKDVIVYGIRWREGGGYKQKMIGTSKTDAVEALTRKKAQIVEKKLGLAVRDACEVLAFSEYAPEYLKRHETKRSANRDRRGVKKVLLKHIGTKPLSEICQLDVERIRQSRRTEGCSNATINRDIALLHHMLNQAVELGYLEHNPIARVKKLKEPPRAPYIFNPDEIDALVAHAPRTIKHMIAIAVQTGMRAGELLALNWEDVDTIRGVITVRHSKSGKPRYLDFSGNVAVVETLRALRNGGRPEGPLFRTSTGARYKWYAQDFKAALKRAGLPAWAWFHDLRHTFGTIASGSSPLPEVQQAMGHSAIAVTMRYVHLNANATRGPLAALAKWREGGRNVLDDVSGEDAAGNESLS
jgi:integrase